MSHFYLHLLGPRVGMRWFPSLCFPVTVGRYWTTTATSTPFLIFSASPFFGMIPLMVSVSRAVTSVPFWVTIYLVCWWLRGFRPSPVIPVFRIPAMYVKAKVHEDKTADYDFQVFGNGILRCWISGSWNSKESGYEPLIQQQHHIPDVTTPQQNHSENLNSHKRLCPCGQSLLLKRKYEYQELLQHKCNKLRCKFLEKMCV